MNSNANANANAKAKPKGPNYLKEEFSPELKKLAEQFTGPLPKANVPSYGQPHGEGKNVSNPYAQPMYGQPPYGQPMYGQPPYGQPMYGPMYGQPTQSFADVVSHPPDLPYQYPSPVQSSQRPELNALAGGSTYTGPFGLSNAKIPKPPNARRILSGIEGGPVQVNSPFPPPGGPITHPGFFTAVDPITRNPAYYKTNQAGGRKTRARRKKRSKTRRH